MTFTSASITNVGGISYYIPTDRLLFPPASRRLIFGKAPELEDALVPISLLVVPDGPSVSGQALSSLVETYLRIDDVFSRAFLDHIWLLTTRRTDFVTLDNYAFKVLDDWGTLSVHAVLADPSIELHGGPYFASGKSLRQAWRLFEDTNGAFMFPVVPAEKDSGTYAVPPTSATPVPSRLYYDKPSPAKPLSGLRVGLKDNIDLKGVRTSAGSRAFQELYPPRESSATCVEKLISAGTIIIGKTKTVQFASGENAKDWFDYQAPFSPRGDGYQDPGCSSTGSAAAMSSYDWVDMTLGTDTFGSVIGPAADHGLFGLRPSLGAVSTKGVVPVSDIMDTIGLFTRNIQLATTAAKVLCGSDLIKNICPASFKILYPTDVSESSPPEYRAYIEPFICKLEEFLKVNRSKIDIGSKFKEQSIAGGSSMQDYLKNTIAHIQLYDCYNNLLPFRQEYQKRFNKKAFADPYIFFKWSLGEQLSEKEYQAAVAERNLFGKWVPESGYEKYCYLSLLTAHKGFGFRDQAISVLAGIPFFTIPIGQYPYFSTVTERKEWIPAAIAFIGPKGSEVAMLELLQDFLEHTPGLHDSVQTGSTAFPIGSEELSASL
ncbi:amidase signature domain-containing protein [Xylogone sp. PMI_703]|nr:amidase signature domain-containing protein [Xylogone sp. PMI_703]